MPTTHTPETIGYLLEHIKIRISGDSLAEIGFYDHEPLLNAAPALYAALSELVAEYENSERDTAETGGILLAYQALAAADGKEQP